MPRRGRKRGRRGSAQRNSLQYSVFGTITLGGSGGTKTINLADLGTCETRPCRFLSATFRLCSLNPVVVSARLFGMEGSTDFPSSISRPQVIGPTTQTVRVRNPRIMDYQIRTSTDAVAILAYGPGTGTITYTGVIEVQYSRYDYSHVVSALVTSTSTDPGSSGSSPWSFPN